MHALSIMNLPCSLQQLSQAIFTGDLIREKAYPAFILDATFEHIFPSLLCHLKAGESSRSCNLLFLLNTVTTLCAQ